MNRFYTSIEQSKHLLSLGLNPESADMFYQWIADAIIIDVGDIPYEDSGCCIPCWSVGALLEVMPNIPDCTIIFAKAKGKYGMCITPLDSGLALNEVEADTPIEVVYNMVIWLLENGYIDKGE